MTTRIYLVYDGRARLDTDDATVLVSCETLEEAIASCDDFSLDSIVFSYDSTGVYLTDKKFEYDPQDNQLRN